MNTNTTVAGVVVAVLLIIAGVALYVYYPAQNNPGIGNATSTTQNPPSTSTQTISDGTITITYPQSEFGMAINEQQILAQSYIPPCDSPFNYCFYYLGSAYKGTNFDGAGVDINKRADLSTERTCLETPPSGFDATMVPTATNSQDSYSMSLFGQVGQGAAGHVSNDSLYRLFIRGSSTCYEFMTRVSKSQFGNYPQGSIQEFTTAQENNLNAKLLDIIKNITISGQKLTLPANA